MRKWSYFLLLMTRSLKLDFLLLKKDSKWSLQKRLSFIALKYYDFALHKAKLKTFRLGETGVKFDDKLIYYESAKRGLFSYQSILINHGSFLSLCNFSNSMTFVDVGANVGLFSVLLAESYPDARILAFEPVPNVFQGLKGNTQYYKNIQIFNKAISSSNGESFMFFNPKNTLTSHISKTSTGIPVETITLDTVLNSQGITQVDLLKVDVEGFEQHVLKGASHTLAITKYILIEISIFYNFEYTFSDILALLNSDEYNFQLISMRCFSLEGADKNLRVPGKISGGDFLFENLFFKANS